MKKRSTNPVYLFVLFSFIALVIPGQGCDEEESSVTDGETDADGLNVPDKTDSPDAVEDTVADDPGVEDVAIDDVGEEECRFPDAGEIEMELTEEPYWAKLYRTGADDWDPRIAGARDHGFFIVGRTDAFVPDEANWYGGVPWILRLDDRGNVLWQKSDCSVGVTVITAANETSDHGVVASGGIYPTYEPVPNDWFFKMNEDGTMAWQKRIGDGGSAHGIIQTSDGGYVGVFDASRMHVLKMDENGNKEWLKRYDLANYDSIESISQTSDNGYILAAQVEISDDVRKIWVAKLDEVGDIEWQKHYDTPEWDTSTSIVEADDGGYIFVGLMHFGYVDPEQEGYNFQVVKLDDTGGILWQKTHVTDRDEALGVVEKTDDGGFILGGEAGNHYDYDFLLVKINADGEALWAKTYGGTNTDRFYSLKTTDDGGFIMAGNSHSFMYDDSFPGLLVIKVDSEGNIPHPSDSCREGLGLEIEIELTDLDLEEQEAAATVTTIEMELIDTHFDPKDTAVVPEVKCSGGP